MPGTNAINPDADRLSIRALRAQPVGRASQDPGRRQVFSAALGQFDELLDAAAVAGPASRPLPLYYALNQAGRAIIAAHMPPGRPWQPSRHGLTAEMPDDGQLQGVRIAAQRKASDDGIVQLLGEAMGTPALKHPTTLAQVWAAIPGFPVPGLGAGCTRPIPVTIAWGESGGIRESRLRLEDPWAPPTPTKPPIRKLIRDGFPRAALGLVVGDVERAHDRFDAVTADISWKNTDGSTTHPRLRAHSYLGEWWLIPKLNPQKDVLSVFMLWWTLLLALSTLARYHPAQWTAALDPDEAWTTTAIEDVLRRGVRLLPHLVLEALRLENRTS